VTAVGSHHPSPARLEGLVALGVALVLVVGAFFAGRALVDPAAPPDDRAAVSSDSVVPVAPSSAVVVPSSPSTVLAGDDAAIADAIRRFAAVWVAPGSTTERRAALEPVLTASMLDRCAGDDPKELPEGGPVLFEQFRVFATTKPGVEAEATVYVAWGDATRTTVSLERVAGRWEAAGVETTAHWSC
jgi:hypothetical protein